MNILHITETAKGGVGTVINKLLSNQVECSNNVSLIYPEHHGASFDKRLKVNFYPFIRTGRNIKSYYSFIKIIISVLKINKYDIIHLHSTFSGLFFRLLFCFLKTNSKIIYCPHAFPFMMKTGLLKNSLYSIIEFILQFRCDHIICVSNYEKSVAKKRLISNSKMVVVYNGIGDSSLRPSIYDSKIEDEISLNVTFIGRFDYQKGTDTLILAIRRLLNSDNLVRKYTFNIIGEGVNNNNDFDFFRSLESKNINLINHGWLEEGDISKILSTTNVVVMPSRWESFGLVVAESFRHGVPVIASYNTSLKELIEENNTGFFFKTEDDEELFTILRDLSIDDLKRLSINCKRKYIESFTSEQMFFAVNNLYKK